MKFLWLFIACYSFSFGINAQKNPLRIWYYKPASIWEEYVPLGNGRLGAMPDGGIEKENIILNDITLWSGAVQNADKKNASQYLPQIRQLLFEGKNNEAEALMSKYFVCEGLGSGYGNTRQTVYGSYQILGNLFINYDYGKDNAAVNSANYIRQLLLNNAIATTVFSIGNTTYTREYFTSFDDDVIVIKLTEDEQKKISFTINSNRPERFTTKTSGDELEMVGQLNNFTDGKGMKYLVKIKIKNEGGQLIKGDSTLQVKDANTAYIYISAGTDYKNPNYKASLKTLLTNAFKKPYLTEKQNHITKFQKLFNRTYLDLGNNANSSLPTDQRLDAYKKDSTDHNLPVLFFQYGRYLLISSTRTGLLPPNLQGLWANTINTPWNGDYHLNINIQMNHFPLEVTNLASLNQPFLQLTEGLIKPGEKTAKEYYNAKGWIAHTITNLWGYTSPGEDYSWGSANTGSAWLCQMLWSHYEFTKDKAYLQKLYPVIKGSAEFYLSTLVKEPSHGWLVTAPSNSPENGFIAPNGKEAHVCEGPTIDNQILRKLFSSVIEASEVLLVDAALKKSLQKAITQLPPNQIASDGRLMEWLKEYKEVEPHHRHVSHLWGLYPGNEISTDATPAIAKAAKASLEARGDDGTGWSLAWKINFWARLHDGNRSLLLLQKLLTPVTGSGFNTQGGGVYKNLFSSCPPLQIDGNFGGTAGIAEMLVQSHEGYIEFLPALPDAWATGEFTGLCARGGAETAAKWANKKVTMIKIKATANNTFKIKLPAGSDNNFRIKKNEQLQTVKSAEGFISLSLNKNDTIKIDF